jgi:hypothetical protein
MEAWNGATSQQEHDGWLQPGSEQEPQWGLCPVSEIYQYAWFFFMQYGLIPWWMQQETPDSLEENFIAAVQRQEGLCRSKWAQAWAGNRLNIQRWVLQCSAALQKTVLHAVFGDAAGKAASAGEGSLLQRLGAQEGKTPAARNRLRFMYWDALFSSLTAGPGPLRLKEKIREKWQEWMHADISSTAVELLDGIQFPEMLHSMAAIPRGYADAPDTRPDFGLEEQVRVKQAGLVLLHGSLQQLFESLQWIQLPEKGILPQYHARAIHLLEFLAGGNGRAPEYDMALHKLLCGIPLDTPVEKDVQLAASEKNAALALLDATALQYFPQGHVNRGRLRSGFLQREGRLQYEKGQWQLQVARQAAASLQAGLPWETACIALPWMQQPLTVQWTT